MQNQALFISICFGSGIFTFIVFLAALQYSSSLKHTRHRKEHPNDWLFHDFYLKIYGACFGNKDEDEVAIKIGINVEKYRNGCKLIKQKSNVKKLVVNYIYAFCSLVLTLLFTILISPFFFIIGSLLFFFLIAFEQQRVDSIAKNMRAQVANELPRFLDLLQTELQVGMPIENAIYTLCEQFPCLISREFLEALNETELGVGGWQEAMEKVAEKYDVDILSDFVLDVSTSYSKGVSIVDAVVRKTKDIKNMYLLDVKERAGKAQNTMIIPMAIFQFIPMMGYLMFPTFVEFFGAF